MATDQAQAMEVDGTQDRAEDTTPAPAPQLQLSLLKTIKTAQAENGLRHGDYMRYRKHCCSRLQSLYKVLKMQHGRTKYQKRKLDQNNISDVRHLHVLLFSAERAWAQAQELKRAAETAGGPGGVDPQKRQHLKRRLAKAVLWAGELARAAAARADTRGALEAEAYASGLGGGLLQERAREGDWGPALARFVRAKKLWQELARASPDLEGQSLCLSQVEELEPHIRYCSYRISRAGGAVPADPEELIAEMEGEEGMGAGLEQLQAKLAALVAEAQQAAAAPAATTLQWLGTAHPVRSERVRAALAAAEGHAEAAEKAMETEGGEGGEGLEGVLGCWERAVQALAEAKSHVRAAVKGLAGPDSEAQFAELEALEGAVEGRRLAAALRRAEAALGSVRGRFGAGLARLAAGKKIKDKERHARPEEVVRCVEALLRPLEDLGELGARLGGRQGERLHDAAGARAAAARAVRCYHLAHAALAAAAAERKEAAAASAAGATANSAKALEAWALFGRAEERVGAAVEALKGLPDGGGEAEEGGAVRVVLPGGPGALVEELRDIAAQAAAYKAVAQAELFAAEQRSREELQTGVGALSLEQPQQPAQQPYLLDALDRWESFAGGAVAAADGAPAGGAAGSKAPPRLYKAPYPFAAVPMRPIMLDTASNCLEYPSLEARVRRAEKKGVLSSLFGWRR